MIEESINQLLKNQKDFFKKYWDDNILDDPGHT
jgi:hypothetical protein